jgi:hypothetical protein
MPLSIKLHRLPGFSSLKVTGVAALTDFVELIQTMGARTEREGIRRVLVDLLEVEGELRFTDHFQLGERAAQQLRHLERIASLVPLDRITRTSEKVAARQGLQLRVFTSMTEAIRWLEEPAPT